jgi:hypothetical protein
MSLPSLFDLYYHVGGAVAGTGDQSFAMSGAGQLAQVGGPLLSRPGEVVPDMAALLFHRPDITNPVAVLADAMGQTFQDRYKELGTGEVTLLNTDPDLGAVWDAECVVRFEIMGRAAFTMIVNELDHVAIAEGEEHDQTTKLAGRAHISVLEESVVYPATGADSLPFSDDRLFSWPSPDLSDSWWGNAHEIAAVADDTPAWYGMRDGWPMPSPAMWIGPSMGTVRLAPGGHMYFRHKFTLAERKALTVDLVADDTADVWFDGQMLGETSQWGNVPSDVYTFTTDASAGEHTLAVHLYNSEAGAPIIDGGPFNPTGFVLSVNATNPDGTVDPSAIVWSDGTWLIVEYPPQPPGFTPGEVIRHVIQEGQARGCFPEITLGFDDQFDSAGNPWTITGDISTKVSTNLWTFIGEELATTYVDVWMGPGDFCLFAWIHEHRGRDRPVTLTGVTDEMDPMSGNLRGLTHHSIR